MQNKVKDGRFCVFRSAFCIHHSAFPFRGSMSDHDPKKTLSEISHLFLSSIREIQTNGVPRPLRTPPQAPPVVPPPAPTAQGVPAREPGGPWSGMNIDASAQEMA